MEKLLDTLATGLAQGTSRRGFLGSMLRGVVGIGLGTAFLVSGRLAYALTAAAIGCMPDYAAPPPDADACPKPKYSGTGGQPNTNCHWDAGATSGRGNSDKYGCRPRSHTGTSWDNDDRPYCNTLNDSSGHPLQCGGMSGTGPPTCPGEIPNPAGYWTCCCNGNDDGTKGPNKSYCYDCNETTDKNNTGRRCVCLKVVPNAGSCA
jgi:hypothetical protein